MATHSIVYDQDYFASGWVDDIDGMLLMSWFDRELSGEMVDRGDGIIVIPPVIINLLEPAFLENVSEFLHGVEPEPLPLPGGRPMLPAGQITPVITVELLAELYIDPDVIFSPIAVRALKSPNQMLKNEVKRIR